MCTLQHEDVNLAKTITEAKHLKSTIHYKEAMSH